MGLKALQTKVAIQSKLIMPVGVNVPSGALLFPRGGINLPTILRLHNTNGITNTAVVEPLPKVSALKTQKQFADNDATLVSKKVVEAVQEEPSLVQINNTHAISSLMPEPLAIYSFKNADVENLLAACYQAYFEDKCSLEFSKSMIAKLLNQNPAALDSIKSSILMELTDSKNVLSQVEPLLKMLSSFDSSLSNRNTATINDIALTKFEMLGPEPLRSKSVANMKRDPAGVLSTLTSNPSVIDTKTSTTLVMQLLSLTSALMKNGGSSVVLSDRKVYNPMPDGINTILDGTSVNNVMVTLPTLSIANDTKLSYLYQIPDVYEHSYIKKLGLDRIQTSDNMRKMAYMLTLMSNEFAISAGLGRLDGTPLGTSFSSTDNYSLNLFGTDGMQVVTTETTADRSLADYLVVNHIDGKNRVQGNDGVLLLDGSAFRPTATRTNSYDAFVKGVLRDPVGANSNMTPVLDSALTAAQTRFDSGIEFFSKLHLRDKDVNLLSPRGLFTRVVKDFSDSLSVLFDKSSVASSQTIRELAMLSIIAKESKSDTSGENPANIIKRFMLTQMAKKAFMLQQGIDSTSSKSSATEAAGQTGNAQIALNLDRMRFCDDDFNVYNVRNQSGLDSLTIECMRILALSDDLPDSITQSFSVGSFFDGITTSNNSFVGKLVKIYIDICDEADKACKSESGDAKFVNVLRLTKNSQIDATIMLSILLESACMLSSTFVNASKPKTLLNNINHAMSESELQDTLTSSSGQLDGVAIDVQIQTKQGNKTNIACRALAALCAASSSNNLDSMMKIVDGNEFVPSLNLPISSEISVDGSHISIASIRDIMEDLSFERDLPAIAMASCSAMLTYVCNSAFDVIDYGKQLLNLKKQSDIVKSVSDFAKSDVGQKYFASLNDFNLESSRRKLAQCQQLVSVLEGRFPKLSLGELNAIKFLFPVLMSGKQSGNIVTVALPKDFIKESLVSSYSLLTDTRDPHQDMTFNVSIHRTSMFSDISFSPVDRNFCIRRLVDGQSFESFADTPPHDINDLLNRTMTTEFGTGTDFLAKKVDAQSEKTTQVLLNDVISHLMRKLFSVLSSADLFPDNIVDGTPDTRSDSSSMTARTFASVYEIPTSTFDNVFVKPKKGPMTISRSAMLDLTKQNSELTTSAVSLTPARLSLGEAELFFDLFSTVWFQVGTLQSFIFSPTAFDDVMGVFVTPEEFSFGGQELTQQILGSKSVNSNQDAKSQSQSSQSPDFLSFDTYSVDAISSSPLVNK